MKKRTLKATDPVSGQVFTRKTHRDYTHIVLIDHDTFIGWSGKETPAGTWLAAWCGRHDLAVKKANEERKWFAKHPHRKAVRIIEVGPER